MAYGFGFNKPFDIKVPITIPLQPSFPSELENIRNGEEAWKSRLVEQVKPSKKPTSDKTDQIITLLVYALFGAYRIVAWNSNFVTPAERILWRVSSISGILLPLAILFCVDVFREDVTGDDKDHLRLDYVVDRHLLRPFTASSLFEDFFLLRSVPVDVYTAVLWSELIPRI